MNMHFLVLWNSILCFDFTKSLCFPVVARSGRRSLVRGVQAAVHGDVRARQKLRPGAAVSSAPAGIPSSELERGRGKRWRPCRRTQARRACPASPAGLSVDYAGQVRGSGWKIPLDTFERSAAGCR